MTERLGIAKDWRVYLPDLDRFYGDFKTTEIAKHFAENDYTRRSEPSRKVEPAQDKKLCPECGEPMVHCDRGDCEAVGCPDCTSMEACNDCNTWTCENCQVACGGCCNCGLPVPNSADDDEPQPEPHADNKMDCWVDEDDRAKGYRVRRAKDRTYYAFRSGHCIGRRLTMAGIQALIMRDDLDPRRPAPFRWSHDERRHRWKAQHGSYNVGHPGDFSGERLLTFLGYKLGQYKTVEQAQQAQQAQQAGKAHFNGALADAVGKTLVRKGDHHEQ